MLVPHADMTYKGKLCMNKADRLPVSGLAVIPAVKWPETAGDFTAAQIANWPVNSPPNLG